MVVILWQGLNQWSKYHHNLKDVQVMASVIDPMNLLVNLSLFFLVVVILGAETIHMHQRQTAGCARLENISAAP